MLGKFLGLAGAQVGGGDRGGHLLNALTRDLRAGRLGQLRQLRQRFADIGGGAGLEFHADEKNAPEAGVAGLEE